MKKIIIWLVISGFVLSGCDDKVILPDDDFDVLVNISTSSLSDIKSAEMTDESLITKYILYAVDGDNKVMKTFPSQSNPSLTGVKLSISKEVVSLYAIANPSTEIESASPKTVSDLLNLTASFATAPVSPFIMGGKGDVIGSNANIELIRAIAKVEVIAQNEFVIESVKVMKTPDQGYVFQKQTISAPPTSTKVEYLEKTTNSTVYVAENSKDVPTEFFVKGKYLDKPTTYTIILKIDGAAIDIERNTYYKVGISALTEFECAITISIPAWSDKPTDPHIIPDDDFDS